MKAILVAYSDNRVIGKHGDIPWMGKMPADMKRVRDLTKGQAIIMGRATFNSIGRALPNRQNIVLTSDLTFHADDIYVAQNLEEAFSKVDPGRDAFIFGGGKVYTESLARASELGISTVFATEIHDEFDGDTHFPELDSSIWHETNREDFPSDGVNQIPYSFVEYKSSNSIKEGS